MKKTKLFLLILILTLAIFLSACSGAGALPSWPGLAVDEERAYLAFNQFIYAVDLETGQLIWRFPAGDPESNVTYFAPPALTEEGDIIVGSYTQSGKNSRLYSLDSTSGDEISQFAQATSDYIASPLVTEQGVFAPNADGYLYALDSDLNYRWKFPTRRAIWASPATNENCDCVYVASMDHSLYAVDADSGEQLWKSADLGGALIAPPTFGRDGTLFIGTSNSQMLALDAQSGDTIWTYNTPGWIWSGAALDNGSLYFGDLKGNLVALTADTGDELWTVKADGAILSKPLVHNEQVYYSTENPIVYAVDLDGKPAWQQEMSANILGPVVSTGDLILVTLMDIEKPLVAYDLDGKLVWSFSPPTD